jgi:hypothetical protein
MLDYLPEIVVDELAAPASKRRRLDTHHTGGVAIESACNASKCEPSPQVTPILSTRATTEEICENTLVCYGMVRRILLGFTVYAYIAQISDLAVNIPLHHVASPVLTQHPLHFEPPRTLCCGGVDTPVGRLDDYGGELLLRLVADDELVLQFVLSSAPIAPITEKKLPKDASQFLGVTIYGPRRRFSDVGDFMTKAGCYLDDPVGCDFDVPYMNPQCLFSFHERPPMTFELLQPQHPHMENFARASLDILSGFETTDGLELSANPTALRTELKMYVICREIGESANNKLTGIRNKHLPSSEDGNKVCIQTRMALVYGSERRVKDGLRAYC